MAIKTESYIPIALIAILIIIYAGPSMGLFSVQPPEEYKCDDGVERIYPPMCDASIWLEYPDCKWDNTICSGYCDSDENCTYSYPTPNDCSLFFPQDNPPELHRIGYCEFSQCKYYDFEKTHEICTGSELFLQKYKYWMAGLIILIIMSFIATEVDYKGKRGFF